MNRSLYALPVMFCLAAAVATAQAPAGDKPGGNAPATQQPPAPKPSTPPASAQPSSAGKVTYTGCVKPGTSADSWILENAEIAAKPGAAPGAVGTSGSKTTLSLDPAASVNLKSHANHKVEVSGTMSSAKPSAGGAGADKPSSSASRQEFSVDSVKMVSATCP